MDLFNTPEEEAFLRINSFWEGKDFTSEDDIIFHESPEFWAKTIYYEQNNWWISNKMNSLQEKFNSKFQLELVTVRSMMNLQRNRLWVILDN
jgi:sensor domain CHASE-containing protein